MEGNADMDPEGQQSRNKNKKETKQKMRRKININKLHANIGHSGEDSIYATAKHLHCRLKGMIEVWKNRATKNIKQELLHKVAEEQGLNPGKMIYLDINSKKKPSYGGPKICILLQDLDTKQNGFSQQRQKYNLLKNSPLSWISWILWRKKTRSYGK